MTDKQRAEFNELADLYATAFILMGEFIEREGLDYDDVWDEANQYVDDAILRGNE
ncbi:hypothetical protein 8F11_36 [uncultured Caudovirales phage]|uniref:Uncharacterized protein n=1 Tax=uncultured Caudovirales phage TaxID=2100421 RepID=A0A2H4J7L7_9CAUD|nr:hypothetical protein 8F11_36 [uncultured Caudovirales phage]